VQLSSQPVFLDLPGDEEEVWLSGEVSSIPLEDIPAVELAETALLQPSSSTHEEPLLPVGGEPPADQTSYGGFAIRLRPLCEESALPTSVTPAVTDTICTFFHCSPASVHTMCCFIRDYAVTHLTSCLHFVVVLLKLN